MARVCLLSFRAQLRTIKEQILEFDRLIRAWHRSNEMSMAPTAWSAHGGTFRTCRDLRVGLLPEVKQKSDFESANGSFWRKAAVRTQTGSRGR